MEIGLYEPPAPPAHLSPSAALWWQTAVDRYVLEEHHLRLLQLVCEAWDRGQGVKSHPCVAIERDARLAVARLVRELDLDVSPPGSERIGPPPLLSNNRGGDRAYKVAPA